MQVLVTHRRAEEFAYHLGLGTGLGFVASGWWGFCRVVRMVRLLRFAAVVALGGIATAGLSACSDAGSDAEVVSPSVSVAASPTPSVTPSPSVTPEEELLARIPENARVESFPSAVVFAQFFIELYAPMFHSPYDTKLFAYLCADGDVFCEDAIARSEATRDAGAFSEGGEFTWLDDAPVGGLNEDGYWYVSQRFSVTDTVTYLDDGSEYRTVRGGTGGVGLRLLFEGGTWRVHGVEFVYDDE